MMQRVILIVDDNDINRLNLRLLLKDEYQVVEAGDTEQANTALAGHRVDLIVLDLALPPEPDNPEIGMRYLEELRREGTDIPVVVITGHDERKLATRARKAGALDFFAKPFDPDEVRGTIDAAMLARRQQLREQEMSRLLGNRIGQELLGDSSQMQELRDIIEQVAAAPSSVLVRGETGSGKELVARLLHTHSARSEGPFIAVNCAAMVAGLLESELFGHEKGAYASATARHLGWFERASGGTLFLDEVSGLPAGVQGKLLRVLERGEFSRLGSEAILHSDVRLICSTREPLEEMVETGDFRDDLYYRINVVSINVPPLREHAGDIIQLAEHFLERKALLCNKAVQGFSQEALHQLTAYAWPGNVRELENVIERAVVLATGSIIEAVPSLEGPRPRQEREDLIASWLEQLPDSGVDAEQLMDEMERRLIETALLRNGRVKARAGRWLGFGERAKDKMRYLCDKHGIQLPGEEE
jgi:DNA-binding NtrC family response regulator